MANKTQTGQIGVTTENIFPVIKQFLYSDHEIFLRELVANAVDATQKMRTMASNGEFKGELGELKVRVELDEKKKTLKIIDNGIGMTAAEVDKYINQIAFSSAGEFLEKYKDQNIIGHFGLGFYSAFMVAKKVTIESLSWKEGSEAVLWSCDGNPEFEMGPARKEERGTVVTLFLDDDSAKDYGTKGKIGQLLGKYCKFMPVPIVFGKEQEWKDNKYVDTDKDHIVNAVEPLWTKKPSELKDEDYVKFYKDLYPMKEDPLFHIHLNVDYPFNLTGILYFPKIKERMAIEKNNIQLYCNQMFVTDHVDSIVPDFLTLLHGVIDSPDIPLNVSRSYLQADENVKKISTYITKKVADRLEEIFKNDRSAWESKWDNLKLFIEYGMLSDEKFGERAMKFALLKNTDGKFFAFDDYRKAIADFQTDKDKKVVYLYATDAEGQYPFIEAAKNKGYDVLLMDCELDSHFVNYLEQKIADSRFARVDSDSVDNLIPKEERVKPEMSEEDKKNLEAMFKAVLPEGNDYLVEADNLGENSAPILITRNEFMRRYREMSALGGGMNFYGEMPESFNITANLQNPLMAKIVGEMKENADKVGEFARGSDLLKQVTDLALLSNGLLKGKALSDFITRTGKTLTDYYFEK
ncbi:MAG: molecular chaperone HtpG [Bacteroidales bacterium]|nr:molecular chaperone HtpG [Bacteroidales bacterium]